MRKILLIALAGAGMAGSAFAQNVTVDVPRGYKVVIVPSSATVPQAVVVTAPAPQTVYVAPAPVAAAPVYHPRARHVASVAEGMVIEHQYDDHH
ncbi:MULTISPECIES: hypothetical protein [Lelliottia]|uniref:Uncharacterized protein n=1 Tax=Lelliottia aquatilis TaxID=2080838 RepID=A0ABX5A7J6_9ENTR|nr:MULTISPECIES: hypothetical protein [Lelliottia]NTZ44859.1 hypothetical protein [Lelliottia aquatilis]POZ28697.1 hypothetical protein C3711_06845 [Lelliottia aquatilis]POZ33652.1 hypothetical protein C3712_00645 [Lelliottia aquatilis]POZ34186.1 hypothetical protein C3708_00645 [Lelliottia sp. 7254-16]POZ34720.1 hypothetical protein C3710_04635 [Lelliottia aquatilis]